jgi:hypothetical protein
MIKDDTQDFEEKFRRMRAVDLKSVRATINDPVCNGVGGGQWLGYTREFIQRKCVNGETVTWGSNEFLKFRGLTVIELEHFAAAVAANAVNEFIEKCKRDGVK